MSTSARGFTLIELMVVVTIIGLLSSVLLVSLTEARVRARDTAGLSGGMEFTKDIANCSIDGGKVTPPNSTTNPTNPLCTLGASYGTWKRPPDGWTWYPNVQVFDQENIVLLQNTYGSKYTLMYCGISPSLGAYCGTPNYEGFCKVAEKFGCVRYNAATGKYE